MNIKKVNVRYSDGSELDLSLGKDEEKGLYVVLPLKSSSELGSTNDIPGALKSFDNLKEAEQYFDELANFSK